jgi:hypothetical protein
MYWVVPARLIQDIARPTPFFPLKTNLKFRTSKLKNCCHKNCTNSDKIWEITRLLLLVVSTQSDWLWKKEEEFSSFSEQEIGNLTVFKSKYPS